MKKAIREKEIYQRIDDKLFNLGQIVDEIDGLWRDIYRDLYKELETIIEGN